MQNRPGITPGRFAFASVPPCKSNQNEMRAEISDYSKGAKGLVIAAHTGDHTIYPDCREDFMQAMGDAMLELLKPAK